MYSRRLTLCAVTLLAAFAFGQVARADAVRATPWLAGVTTDSVYVSLEADTDASTSATVDYGLLGDGYTNTATTQSAQGAGSNYVHNIKLTGLAPNTQYHYRVTHGSDTSDDYTFWTAPEPGTAARWGFAADCRSDPTAHNTMAGYIASHDPRMMVYGGDLWSSPSYSNVESQWLVDKQNSLNATTPWVNATGNHENWNSLTQAFTQSPNGDDPYFSFDYGDAHILVLNNQVSDSEDSAQWDFAAADLAATTQKWKIVAFHKLAYVAKLPSGGGHDPDSHMVDMTEDIFEPNGVDVVLTGHTHFYQHNLVNDIHHMVLGSFGVDTYNPGDGPWTVYSENTRNFGVFDTTPTSLTLTTYRWDNTVIEKIVVPEPAS